MPSLITIDSETDFGNNSASLSPQSSGTARAGSLGIRIPIIRRTTQPSATFTSSSSRVDTQSPVMISPTSPSNESNSGFGVSNAWNESGNTIDRSISEGGDSGSTVSHSGAEKPPPLPPRKQKGKSFDLHDSGIGRNPMDIDISPNVVVTGFSSPCANITPLTDDTGQPLYDALPRNEEIGSPANYDFFEPLPTISLTTVESSEPSTYSTLPRSGERRESGGRSPQCYDTLARLGRDFPTASAFATPSQVSFTVRVSQKCGTTPTRSCRIHRCWINRYLYLRFNRLLTCTVTSALNLIFLLRSDCLATQLPLNPYWSSIKLSILLMIVPQIGKHKSPVLHQLHPLFSLTIAFHLKLYHLDLS